MVQIGQFQIADVALKSTELDFVLKERNEIPFIVILAFRRPVRLLSSLDNKSLQAKLTMKRVFDYVYTQGGQMKGLRNRSTAEYGLMRSKILKRISNRKVVIHKAIKNNLIWNTRFREALKKGKVLSGRRCCCESVDGTKIEKKQKRTISDAYYFCNECKVFYART